MADKLRLLLIEDTAADAELMLLQLKRAGMHIVERVVETEQDFRNALLQFEPHVILSDFNLPQFNGMAALEIAHASHPEIPFIFVSGTIGEEYAIRAMKCGATDYVLKDNLMRLPPVVDRALQEARAAAEQRRMQAALRLSELRFRLAASTGDIWDWTPATGEACISRQWKERLGYEDAEIENTAAAWLALLPPGDRRVVIRAFAAHLRRQVPYDVEYRARDKSGQYRWSHAKGQAVWDAGGEATYMAGSVVDITERKGAETKIRRLNRVYAVLSGINALSVRVQHRDELFAEACRIAVDTGHFSLAWLGVVEKDTMQIRPVAFSGAEPGFLEVIQTRLRIGDGGPEGSGPPVRAVRQKTPVISNDVESDPRISLKSEHRKRGVVSLAALPLLVAGEAVGVLVLHSPESGFFDAEEMRLLRELAGDIAFTLDHIEKAEKLDYLAYYDALTGLANRTLFHERLTQHIDTARREGHKLAVLAVNIGRFKAINDTLGRPAGDELLKQIAARFLRNSEDKGTHARIDADRFAAVVPEVTSEQELARHIETRSQEYFGPPFLIGDAELRVTDRVGVAVFPNDGNDADTLFRHAEAAAERAKATGERHLFYAQDMTDRIAGKLALENKLRHALEKDEFVLHYQPKVDTDSRRIVGVEALIRWQSPELGLVPPMQFIPLMEETGLILEVGAWALHRAVLDHRFWQGVCAPRVAAPRIAVNVSPIQLRKQDFVDGVRAAIAAGATPPGIDLEITESLVMEDIEANIGKLNTLRKLGLSIAVDDFGTGYSSLRYLAKLPVQTLKIDRSFIVTMLDEADTMTLVSTIISLAHSLRLKVVAEGVETEDQAKMLRLLQCDEMQGYLFSRPLPLEQMMALHARSTEADAAV